MKALLPTRPQRHVIHDVGVRHALARHAGLLRALRRSRLIFGSGVLLVGGIGGCLCRLCFGSGFFGCRGGTDSLRSSSCDGRSITVVRRLHGLRRLRHLRRACSGLRLDRLLLSGGGDRLLCRLPCCRRLLRRRRLFHNIQIEVRRQRGDLRLDR